VKYHLNQMREESNLRPWNYISSEYVTGAADVQLGNNEMKKIQRLPKLDEGAG